MEYTVEQHSVLIGLAGKVLEEHLGDYGLDLFVNSIVKYAKQRGGRMQRRAIRDGRPLNFETFQSYGELKINTLPGDYSIQSEHPVYINCCHRCMWYEGWKKYDLVKWGALYCKYVDINLVQGFSEDMVMIAKTMLGCGDEYCTFVSVGYEQTEEAKQRIAKMRQELNGCYAKDFLYHLGHYLNAFCHVINKADAVDAEAIMASLGSAFEGIYGKELKDLVWEKAKEDYDSIA